MLKSKVVDTMRQKCSEVTLQSEAQGHFGTFVKMILDANPDCLETFSKLETDEERVMFCSLLNKVDHMLIKPVFKPKNSEMANLKRTEGNEAFQKKRYKQAAMLYTLVPPPPYPVYLIHSDQAVAGQETLAYSLANRSACHYYLGDINSCLQDIEQALTSGYPSQLKYKLYERRAKCHLLTHSWDLARTAVTAAKKSLEANKAKLDEKKQIQAKKSLKEIQEAISGQRMLAEETILMEERTEPRLPKLSQGSNKKQRNLSSLVKVEFSEGVGRHVVAAKQVKAGDTIAVENPVACVLYTEQQGTNCDFCLAKLRSAVPCPYCAGVAFCSPECRDQALASYHRYECSHQDILLGLGSSALVRLAYRIVGTHSLKFFNNIKHHLNVDEKRADIDSLALHYSIPGVSKESYLAYLNLFNLVGLDQERWVEDQFNRALMSLCLLKILKDTSYFPQKSSADVFTSDEVFIGSLMMRHMNVLQFNAHEIYEFFRGDRSKMKPNKNHLIGVGVYPQASFFNHSCHPGTARYNIGRTMVLRSLSPLSPGQEVTENYGPVFYFKDKANRQKELAARYWFSCDCRACREDWPLLKENTKVRWRGEKDEAALEDLRTVYECGADFTDHAQTEDAVENLTEYINSVASLVDHPLEVVIRAEDKLRTCFNNSGTVLFQETGLRTNKAENRR